ncbi:hypothetical protein K450DRAFT_220674 [Umbelopsis ramanniana AG]|uniref:Uncharacterized protein n=1 Tax=Umbelopsis ramanniana AG TaxID=1314678 RepID=A0AAD5HGW8_UMBRA|nr:uncharacterized protein K450DRAFT_220674 [Umbelopsis ramanniana AG]KAI8583935.1 hypothetical protein K450DRAFT_220674 [Umbelopsis ramanniana AG]
MSPVSTSNMKHSKLTTTSAVKHTKSPLSISHLPPTSDNDPHTPNKYNLLKREIKQLAERNGSMTRSLESARKRIKTLRKERSSLLDKIARAESMIAASDSDDSSDLADDLGYDDESDGDSSLDYARYGSQSEEEEEDIDAETTDGFLIPGLSSNRVAYMTPQRIKPLPGLRESTPTPSSSSRKTRRVMYVEKDEEGNYRLPVQIGALTLLSLGQVVWDREGFHNDRYIWPIGYSVQRSYMSMINPESNTIYTCTIEDGGDAPQFRITPEDAKEEELVSGTATGVWTTVVKRANQIRHRDVSNSVSGPEYFGFAHPTIAKMIQDLPGAERCGRYKWQDLVVVMPSGQNGSRSRKGGNTSESKQPSGEDRANSATAEAAASPSVSGLKSPTPSSPAASLATDEVE